MLSLFRALATGSLILGLSTASMMNLEGFYAPIGKRELKSGPAYRVTVDRIRATRPLTTSLMTDELCSNTLDAIPYLFMGSREARFCILRAPNFWNR